MFELQAKRGQETKNLTVRLPKQMRDELDKIASERNWILTDMVKEMISHYVNEYKKLGKPKQTKFDFVR